MRAEQAASVQRSALAATSAEVEQEGIKLRVGASGELLDFALTKDVGEYSAVTWSRHFMDAYRAACDAANRSTATTLANPALQQMVLASVPADVLACREETPSGVQPAAMGAPDETIYLVDDLPPDPSLEPLFSVLDSDDPLASLIALSDAGEFDMVDLSRPAHEIDTEIRSEIEAIAARIDELGPALRQVTAEARNEAVSVIAGPWGQIEHLEFRSAALRDGPEQLIHHLLTAYREATDEAAATLHDLLSEQGLHDETDPTLARVGAKRRNHE